MSMTEEGNGQGSPTRLDRIERAIKGLTGGHERLVVLHQQLLTAQIIMTETVKKLLERPPNQR